jgi:Zn-dependent protease
MTPTRQGSVHLFRLFGVELFLHWSWFVVAMLEVNNRGERYESSIWNLLEYLSLFLIVTLHEFGHALACRQVGGRANQIVLWPLGGVAYVDPPPRPGPTLWSIAAGPLVNVALFPALTALLMAAKTAGWGGPMPDFVSYLRALWFINCALLVFNLLPIYPLDGGQIFRALLWFVVGRARSLMIASIVGFVGVAALIVVAVIVHSIWLGIMSVFVLLNCWNGLLHARLLARAAGAPRHEGFICPSCKTAPPQGPFWGCAKCRKIFDTFETRAVCPQCGTQFAATRCPDCGHSAPLEQWMVQSEATSQPPP